VSGTSDAVALTRRLAHATHYVFRSNEADVLRDIRITIDGLPLGR
jgi:hypothetical protein